MREPTPVPPVRVHRQNELAGLIPSSPHSVHWNHKQYPTASHLHEALKFMGHRPDIAEAIRHCPTVDEYMMMIYNSTLLHSIHSMHVLM